jgi:hypothetical protein
VAEDSENTFPMDFYADDPSPRPWKFQPKGYLVMILTDADEAQRAEAALVADGFAARDVKVYTGKQILQNYETYLGHRNITDSVAGSVIDDAEGKELYLGYAGEGRSALWLRLPDEDRVRKAMLVLADFDYLLGRYYGAKGQTDFRVS